MLIQPNPYSYAYCLNKIKAMHKPILFLLFLVLIGHSRVNACSCIYIETFCETLGFSDTIYHDLIILGTVVEKNSNGMEVLIAERLYGTEDNLSIFIVKGNGGDCGENTDNFRKGQTLILALHEAHNRGRENHQDYFLSICGINYLEVDRGIVKGLIAPGVGSISYKDFKRISTCSTFKFFDPEVIFNPEIKVYPNPAKDEIFIEVDEAINSFNFTLNDIQGRIVLEGIRKEIEADSQITIDLPVDQLSNGLYFLRISSDMGSNTVKVMIMGY